MSAAVPTSRPVSTATSKTGSLRRQLGLTSATAVVAGECIAVGIFLTPAGMAKSLGSPFWLLLVWIAVGALTISGVLTFSELASRFPRNGGAYIYPLENFGPQIAFLYGWMSLLVLDPGLTAALATGLAGYAGYILHLSPLQIKLVAVSVISALSVLNIFSVRISAGVLRWSTWLKLLILGTLIFWALAFRLGTWLNFTPFIEQRRGSLPLGPALGVGMVGAFFLFGGWWDVSKMAGEIRDPGRTLPRAMLLGVSLVTVVYILVSGVFLYLVPLAKVTSDETFVAQAGAVLFGALGAKVFAAIVVLCVFSSLAALIMAAPRVYFAMARDGLFLHSVARVHPRFGTPAIAIALQGTIGAGLAIMGNFEQIISYFIFVAVIFLGLTGAGLIISRSRRLGAAPEFQTPLYPLPPVAYLVLIILLMLLVALHSPRQAMLGTGVVLVGVPVYRLLHLKRTQSDEQYAKSCNRV